jgi:predicted nucleic acid-binding Zn ribbon protein
MSDDPVKECEVCGEPVKRLLFPVAVHFKGNGFYSTDYAKKNAIGTAGSNAANGGGSDLSSSSDDKGSAEVPKPPAANVTDPVAATAKND